MNQQLIYGVAAVPAIIGLVEVAKQIGVPDRGAPAVAILLGILAGLAEQYGVNIPWIQAVTVGIGLGLSSVGLHATTTHAISVPDTTPVKTTRRIKPKAPAIIGSRTSSLNPSAGFESAAKPAPESVRTNIPTSTSSDPTNATHS